MPVVPNQKILDSIEHISWDRIRSGEVSVYLRNDVILDPNEKVFVLNLSKALQEYISGLLNLPLEG